MLTGKNRGAPTKKSLVEFPPAPAKVVEVQVTELHLVCPCCGRGAPARVERTRLPKRWLQCKDCLGRYVAVYEGDKPVMVRALSISAKVLDA